MTTCRMSIRALSPRSQSRRRHGPRPRIWPCWIPCREEGSTPHAASSSVRSAVFGPVRRPLEAVGETSDGSRERAPEVLMDVPLWAWAAVLAVILAMLAVDLVAHRSAHVVSVREAAGWTAVWVSLGLAFGGVVWWAYGSQAGGEYFAGYLIEKSLAVDNVFVFALIFSYFAVPREYQHRVLFYGVIGALVFRAIFIAGGAVVIEQFAWVLYLLGAFLVFTGWKMFTHRNDEMDPSRNPVLRLVRRRVPSTDEYHGQRFWVQQAGRWVATPLFTVLVLVETTDIIFAVDFLLADLIHRFVYLKAGLAAILVLVGVKMLLLDVWKVPIWLSLAAITTSLTTAVVLSMRAPRNLSEKDGTPVAGAGPVA